MYRSASERVSGFRLHIDAIPTYNISDKLWESALADPFQFTIYSRQKESLSRHGAKEDGSYYKAMYIC